jgi:glycosyltransferase involved in cell wall biosynthesis
MGGVNYVLNWMKALNYLSVQERPAIILLYRDQNGEAIANENRQFVSDIRPFHDASRLNLDMVYPVTQIYEAPRNAPWAAWIPDWQYKHMPEMFDESELIRRDNHYRLMATKAPLVCVSSQMAYDDTINAVGSESVPICRLNFPTVINEKDIILNQKEISTTLKKYNIEKKFFLVCNQFWKHKNHMLILKALSRLSDTTAFCVFTGARHDERWPLYFKEFMDFIADNHLSSSVRVLGQIPRKDQLALMVAALAVIQPSQFEGWSTVVEEAKALNKTIFLSKFPVHFEQAPEKSHFFDPLNEDELCDLMKKKISDSSSPYYEINAKNDLKAYDKQILKGAKRFLEIARETHINYDPKKHDPASLLIDLLKHPKIYVKSKNLSDYGQQEFSRATAYLSRQTADQPATKLSKLKTLFYKALKDRKARLELIHKLEKAKTKNS